MLATVIELRILKNEVAEQAKKKKLENTSCYSVFRSVSLRFGTNFGGSWSPPQCIKLFYGKVPASTHMLLMLPCVTHSARVVL